MWKRLVELLGRNTKPPRNTHGPISIKSKGSQSLTIGPDGKMIVYADDPEIKAPADIEVEVRPLKDKP